MIDISNIEYKLHGFKNMVIFVINVQYLIWFCPALSAIVFIFIYLFIFLFFFFFGGGNLS